MKIANTKVNALLDKAYSFIKQEEYHYELYRGNPISIADFSLPSIKAKEAFSAEVLKEISALRRDAAAKPDKLNHYDDIALDVLAYYASYNFMVGKPLTSEYYYLSFDITPYNSMLPVLDILGQLELKGDGDVLKYLEMLDQYGALLKSMKEKTLEQAGAGIYLPKGEIGIVLDFLRGLDRDAGAHPFVLTQQRLKNTSDSFDRERAIDESKRSVTQAMRELRNLIGAVGSEEYRSNSGEAIGLSQYPGGKEYYRYLVEHNTAEGVTPEELHQLGLRETARLEEKMATIRKDLGYDCTREEFKAVIESMPELYEKTAEDIGLRLNAYVDRIRPLMGGCFEVLCKADCEAKRLPAYQEGGMTFGYYRQPTAAEPKGVYYYNGANAEEKNMLQFASTMYHELLPGHHFQINLAQENESLHPFFKLLMNTAYTEGWAEYSAALAGELGMYESPLDEYGRLTMDLFLTARLVVDTGLNDLGWSIEKASKTLKDCSEWNDEMIYTEVNRYANDLPGHALGYKYGSLKMAELRDKVKRALGDSFDLREYHSRALEFGSIPLETLEKHLDWYVEQKLRRKSPAYV
jgi:uncharacterized protein (DUF885 family)